MDLFLSQGKCGVEGGGAVSNKGKRCFPNHTWKRPVGA